MVNITSVYHCSGLLPGCIVLTTLQPMVGVPQYSMRRSTWKPKIVRYWSLLTQRAVLLLASGAETEMNAPPSPLVLLRALSSDVVRISLVFWTSCVQPANVSTAIGSTSNATNLLMAFSCIRGIVPPDSRLFQIRRIIAHYIASVNCSL